MSAHDRFNSKYIVKESGCWEWIASKNWRGYGQFRFLGKNVKAHRYSYEYFIGEIPTGLTIDHQCNNKACVNPEHLRAMTMRENLLRSNSISTLNLRKKKCVNGHGLTQENVRLVDGRHGKWRQCITCKRAGNRAYKSRKALNV